MNIKVGDIVWMWETNEYQVQGRVESINDLERTAVVSCENTNNGLD